MDRQPHTSHHTLRDPGELWKSGGSALPSPPPIILSSAANIPPHHPEGDSQALPVKKSNPVF